MATWPASGDTDWNTKMLANLAVGHDTDGTHKKSQMLTDMDWSPTSMSGADDSIGTVTYPNGLIMKWGKATVSGGGGTITFAVAFSNACFQVIICGGHATSGTTQSIMSHTITTSSFGWESGAGDQVTPARWFAIGY